MSDEFNHEADAWDDLLFGQSADGDDGDDDDDDASSYRSRYRVTCKKCGMTGLKWRTNAEGYWRLYENARVEHNRLKPHDCEHPTAQEAFGG